MINFIVISKLLYYCFVEKFDLSDRNLMVVNQNDPQWDIHISKLSLHTANYVLRGSKKLIIPIIHNLKERSERKS